MLKPSAALLLVLGSTLGATAFAADFARPAPNETGTVYSNPQYAVVQGRLQRIDDLNAGNGAEHDFVLAGATLAHSDKCDHMVRTAIAPTASEIDAMRVMSPG